jgi:hypothetical protein
MSDIGRQETLEDELKKHEDFLISEELSNKFGSSLESILRKLDEISGSVKAVYDLMLDEDEDMLLEHPAKRVAPDFRAPGKFESQLEFDYKKNFFNKNPFN